MKIIKRYDFLVNFITPLKVALRCGDLTIALLTLKWMLHLQFSSLSLLTHIFRKLRHQAIEIYPKNYFIHYFWYWKSSKTLPDLKVATLYKFIFKPTKCTKFQTDNQSLVPWNCYSQHEQENLLSRWDSLVSICNLLPNLDQRFQIHFQNSKPPSQPHLENLHGFNDFL